MLTVGGWTDLTKDLWPVQGSLQHSPWILTEDLWMLTEDTGISGC